ncbi:hypothetical protein COP2_039532 [Malus domestica]
MTSVQTTRRLNCFSFLCVLFQIGSAELSRKSSVLLRSPIFLVDPYEIEDSESKHVGAFQLQFVLDGGAARDLHVHLREDAVSGRPGAKKRISGIFLEGG